MRHAPLQRSLCRAPTCCQGSKHRHSVSMRILPLLLVVLLAGCTAAPAAESSEPGRAQDATAPDGVTAGGVLYVLNDAVTRTRIGEETARNGTFLVLQIGVRNTREETALIAADQFTVEAGSTTYGVSGDAAAALRAADGSEVLDRQRIDPGFQTRVVLAFDVPVRAAYTLHITQDGETGRMELTP